MTGHGSRARRRAFVGALGALSIALFGAAATADDGDPGRDGPRSAAPTTETPDDSLPSGTGGVDDTSPTEEPVGLGTDPELDALAQACFDGDLVACDHLFLQSPVDSDYEEYGDTCAGRQEPGTESYCGLGSEADPGPDTTEPVPPIESGEPTPPDNLGTDPTLNALADECYVGDMEACDDLYDASEEDSPYRVYGDTCAGRQPEFTGRYCRDLEDPVPGTVPDSTVPDDTVLDDTVPDDTVPDDTVPDDTVPDDTVLDDTSPVDTGAATTPPPVTAPPVTTPGAIPPPTEEPVGLGNDPALDGLAEACHAGDMAACDNLFNESDPGSTYRRYGDTCAGRQAESTGVWCRTAFGDATQSTNVTVPATTFPLPTPPDTAPPLTVPPLTVPPPTVPPLTAPTVPPLTVPPMFPTVPDSTVPVTTDPAGVIPPPTVQPVGLGTDPALDALAQSCYDGDMAACDELFRESEPELDPLYRDFGDTCAGRQPSGTGRWCEASFPVTGAPTTMPGDTVPGTAVVPTVPGTIAPTGIPPATQQPTGLGSDPQLDALAQSCFDGAMQACDDLFLQSELGTPYHEYGDTCAGRQPTGTYTYCHVAFPNQP